VKADPNAKEFSVEDVSIPNEIGFDRTMRRRRMLDRLDGWQRLLPSQPADKSRHREASRPVAGVGMRAPVLRRSSEWSNLRCNSM
jgi:hypothetical protein